MQRVDSVPVSSHRWNRMTPQCVLTCMSLLHHCRLLTIEMTLELGLVRLRDTDTGRHIKYVMYACCNFLCSCLFLDIKCIIKIKCFACNFDLLSCAIRLQDNLEYNKARPTVNTIVTLIHCYS